MQQRYNKVEEVAVYEIYYSFFLREDNLALMHMNHLYTHMPQLNSH